MILQYGPLLLLMAISVLGQDDYASTVTITAIGSGSRAFKHVIESTISAFELSQSQYLVQYQLPAGGAAASGLGRSLLRKNEVDFAASDIPHQPSESIGASDLVSLPFAAQALVPVVNLPGIEEDAVVITPLIWARIFMGNITKWNDASLVAINPGIALPDRDITLVVRSDSVTLNSVLWSGFAFVCNDWKQNVKLGSDGLTILWPFSDNLIERNDFFSHGTAMATIEYTLGYMWLDEANDLGITALSFIQSSGATLAPTSDSVLFAVMEKGGVPLPGTGASIDLTGTYGLKAWPFTGYCYLILRKTAYRETCAIKTAMLTFWQFFYQSTTANTIATSLGFVIPPSQIREAHGIDTLINTNIFCGGDLSLPAARTEESIGVGSLIAGPLFDLYPPVYNDLSGASGTIVFQPIGSDQALQRLLFGEVDYAVTVASIMRQDLLLQAIDSGYVMELPVFAARFVLIFYLPSLDATDQIIVDFDLLSDIWSGRVTMWNDPAFRTLNPALAAAGKLPNLNITRVVVTSGEREAEKLCMQVIHYWCDGTDHPFNITYDSNGIIDPYMSMPFIPAQSDYLLQVGSDYKVQAAVTNRVGSVGIIMANGDLEDSTQRFLLKARNGDVVNDSPDSAYRCITDTFNITSLRTKFYISEEPGCWPFTGIVYTMVRTRNYGTDQCTNAERALRFMEFLHSQSSSAAEVAATYAPFGNPSDDSTLLESLTSNWQGLTQTNDVAQSLGLLWQPPAVRAMVERKLRTITCDGETILVTLPVDYRITAGVQAAALGISILGCVTVALAICFIYFFHLRTSIKAASPIFLLGTLIGLVFIFVAGTLLIHSYPDDTSCSSGWWLLNIGFYMTFGPLFGKAWRIYKIFMRKEMTVVKITDLGLMVRLAVGLSLEMILLGVMQATGPVKATSTVQSALPRDQTIYYCAPQNVAFAACLGGYKGLMLLFGALMSFSTRTVSENFNESKSIAFSIYNVLFTMLLVLAIGLLQSGDGRTLYIVVGFTAYWIALTTFSIIFAPKVVTIYKDASGLIAHRISDSKASASELSRNPGPRTIKEFAAQPIRLMDRVSLRTYAVLLEREISLVRAALATLDANETVLAHAGTAAAVHAAASVRRDSKNGGSGNTPNQSTRPLQQGGSPRNSVIGASSQPPPSTSPPASNISTTTSGPGFGRSMYKYQSPSPANATISNGNGTKSATVVPAVMTGGNGEGERRGNTVGAWEGKTMVYHGPTTAQLAAAQQAAAAVAAVTALNSNRASQTTMLDSDAPVVSARSSIAGMHINVGPQPTTTSPGGSARPLSDASAASATRFRMPGSPSLQSAQQSAAAQRLIRSPSNTNSGMVHQTDRSTLTNPSIVTAAFNATHHSTAYNVNNNGSSNNSSSNNQPTTSTTYGGATNGGLSAAGASSSRANSPLLATSSPYHHASSTSYTSMSPPVAGPATASAAALDDTSVSMPLAVPST